MSRVEILPDALVDQIAAGEVVERPASVVKELVENALDAGATRIDVAITEGGVRGIEVTDDGSGMLPDDAERAFLRHATSKLSSAEQLAAIDTLGFRGEALPSIAAVARVRLRTRTADRALGCEVVAADAGVRSVRELACAQGTRVEVAELFANVPARRKFLKAPVTESAHVVRWLERIALARPDVRIALERDGRPALLFLPTGDVRERVIAALPHSVGEGLLEVKGEMPQAEIFGYATASHVSRSNTGDIHVFVNARPVRDRLLLFSVREAYRDALRPGRHPAAALYLRVDPSEVDVNVHPAKSEVRFRDPRAISSLIRRSLIHALGRDLGATADAPRDFVGASGARPPADFALAAPLADFGPAGDPGLFSPETAPREAAPSVAEAPFQSEVSRPPGRFAEHRYLGQVLATYLVLAGGEGIVLVDQHAAHERVLFERLRASLLDGKLERQALLVPVSLELSTSAAEALFLHAAALERAGFELERGEGGVRGGVRVRLRTVPALLADTKSDWPALLEETAALLREPDAAAERGGIDAAFHHIFATAACHAAVRKGDRLDAREVRGLLEALDQVVWFPNCPHGRPVLSLLSEPELERRFGRR